MGKFLVSLISTLGGIVFFFMFISMILYIIFGQVTVRKLRKTLETKHELGIEFASGWDIINAAQALSLPKFLQKRVKNKAFHANPDVLYKHTTVFDRVLARMFYWLWMSSSFALIILVMLNFFWSFV